MNGQTGGKAMFSGIYKCKDHPNNTKPVSKGATFPPCNRGEGHGATWILVRRTDG